MHRQHYVLQHLSRRFPQRVCRPFWMADHQAMPTRTAFHHIECTWVHLLRSFNHHVYNSRLECRLILLSDDESRRSVFPSSVSSLARIDPKALGYELRNPFLRFLVGDVIVEDFLRVFRVNCDHLFLEKGFD